MNSDYYEPGSVNRADVAQEVPSNGMAPAVANAIYDALGVRIRSLLITPEKILQALDEMSGTRGKA